MKNTMTTSVLNSEVKKFILAKTQICFTGILLSIAIITEIPLIALLPILLVVFELVIELNFNNPQTIFIMSKQIIFFEQRQIKISVSDFEIQLSGLSEYQMSFIVVLLSIAIAITIPLIAVLPLLL